MLLDKAEGSNSIMQEKYVTVSVCKRNIEEARAYFARVFASLFTQFNQIGSHCDELNVCTCSMTSSIRRRRAISNSISATICASVTISRM